MLITIITHANSTCISPTTWPSLSPLATLHHQHNTTSFKPLTVREISLLLTGSCLTTCPTDPVPATLFQAITPTVYPAVTSMINVSLASGTFPSTFEQARVMPLLKKPSINPTQIVNYWPVSLLPFLQLNERSLNNSLSFSLILNLWTQTTLVSKVVTQQ